MRASLPFAALLVSLAVSPAAGERGAVARERTTHFVLHYDAPSTTQLGFERWVLESLEASHRSLDQLLGMKPRGRIAVAIHEPGDFDRRAGVRGSPSTRARFDGEQIHVRRGVALDAKLEAALAHELVGAAFHQTAPPDVLPGWFREGLALWFEGRRLGKRQMSPLERSALVAIARRGAWLGPETLSVPSFDLLEPGVAYGARLQSYALVEHLVERRGERVLHAWMRESLRSGEVGVALGRSAGFDLAALDHSLRDSLGLRAAVLR